MPVRVSGAQVARSQPAHDPAICPLDRRGGDQRLDVDGAVRLVAVVTQHGAVALERVVRGKRAGRRHRARGECQQQRDDGAGRARLTLSRHAGRESSRFRAGRPWDGRSSPGGDRAARVARRASPRGPRPRCPAAPASASQSAHSRPSAASGSHSDSEQHEDHGHDSGERDQRLERDRHRRHALAGRDRQQRERRQRDQREHHVEQRQRLERGQRAVGGSVPGQEQACEQQSARRGEEQLADPQPSHVHPAEAYRRLGAGAPVRPAPGA